MPQRPGRRRRRPGPRLSWPLLGHRRLDPCGLLSPDALRRFGTSSLTPDYGNFDRCDVFTVHEGRSVQVTALATLGDDDGQAGPPVPARTVGNLQVAAKPPEPLACVRRITLPGGVSVNLRASLDDGADPALCSIADLAADSTVNALSEGDYPIRTEGIPRSPLGTVDACDLVPAGDLPRAPDAPAWTSHPAFGRWSCRWDAPGRAPITLRFDRDTRGIAAIGNRQEQVGGRAAVVAAGDPGACEVSLSQHRYQRPDASPGYEVVLVETSRATMPDPCEDTRRIAAAAATHLPPPS